MKKFWKWKNQTENSPNERILTLNGTIAEESWFDDDVTPQLFKDELNSGTGKITVWINSPGGDCVAAAQIYNMLMDYKGNVTVKIDGIAASAASVIAMAGTEVLMSPVSTMMIHNPATVDEVIWLITLLANQSVLIHNLKNPDDKKPLLSEDEVELLTSPFDLAEYKSAIMDSMHKGTKRNIESEQTSKNTKVG